MPETTDAPVFLGSSPTVDPTRLAMLRQPFPPDQIGKLPKRSKREDGSWGPTVYLDYVGHADLTARLLDVDPTWTWEPLALTPEGLPALDKSGNLWIRLTVCGVTRIGVGDGKNAKEVIGDALRNAAMRFGAALELWAKGDRDYAHAEAEAAQAIARPEHVERVYATIAPLSDEDKKLLRAWYDDKGYPASPNDLNPDQAQAVCDYAVSLQAWPDQGPAPDPDTTEVPR